MKHKLAKHLDLLDEAITLEEWHRANDAVRPGRASQIVRHHEHAGQLLA